MQLAFGGRAFVIADLSAVTFEQAHYLMQHAERIGLDAIWPLEGESDEDYDQRLRWQVVPRADAPAMLAGYLAPPGEPWTREGAEATRRHLAALTDPQEHAQLLSLVAQVAPDFFGRALTLFGTSRVSSVSALQGTPNRRPVH
jgi:hypothetical protein